MSISVISIYEQDLTYGACDSGKSSLPDALCPMKIGEDSTWGKQKQCRKKGNARGVWVDFVWTLGELPVRALPMVRIKPKLQDLFPHM